MLGIIIATALLFGAGLTVRIWKHGPKFRATWWRAASYNLMVGGLALLTILPDWDWHGLLWLEISIFIFCGTLFVTQKRAKRFKAAAAKRNFKKLSKEEFKKLDEAERKAYKEQLKDIRKEIRQANKWTKAQIIIVGGAASTALFIYLIRLGFKINVDGDYRPAAWWPLVIVLVVLVWSILLWAIPLPIGRFKRWFIAYVCFVGPAIIALSFALWLAVSHFVAVADEVQKLPGEGEQDASVEATTAIDNCPQSFRLDELNRNGEIDFLEENAREEIDFDSYPDANRAALDPEFLIEEAVDRGIWEEGQFSVEMLVTSDDETESNVNQCLTNFHAWVALAKMYPETWEAYVREELASRNFTSSEIDSLWNSN
jgi:hypothetical protein